jgi:hypothetical protein
VSASLSDSRLSPVISALLAFAFISGLWEQAGTGWLSRLDGGFGLSPLHQRAFSPPHTLFPRSPPSFILPATSPFLGSGAGLT